MLDTLGHYKILGRIGAGGMGEVYRARDTRLGRTVAVKLLPADVAADPDRRGRFLREARATTALSHPNIAALYEIGEDQGHVFLVFEFVPGETLKSAIDGRPMNPRRAIDLAAQIADGLADAHAEGIVHRDIKPSNIMVTPKGAAKILDFGLATWTAGGIERDAATTMLATSPETTLGTVAYMSPEQALGEAVDRRTDIFSLGIVLFEMLTGRLPFTGATHAAVALQIVQATAPAPSAINRSLPPEIDPIVSHALAKSLEARYDSAATFAAELRAVGAILDVRSAASQPSVRSTAFVPRRRHAAGPWIAAAIILTATAAGLAWQRAALVHLWTRATAPPPAPIIAVMPLELAGADPSQQFFADGLTEDLITRLGQTPGLKVLGRSATRTYRDRTPRDVAAELGAAVVMTGSVRPDGDQVRISLELIDPRDGAEIWTGQYAREVRDIFAVQAQVATDVAQALRLKLQPTAASERTSARLVDRRAYELYLRGRQAAAERRLSDAVRLYSDAIAADAGLAEAFAGLAEALHLEALFDGKSDGPRRQRMKEVAARAYEIDPDSPQVNLAIGLAADGLSASLRYMRRAIELDPSFTEAYQQTGEQIVDVDPDLAARFYRKSLEIDPRFDLSHIGLSVTMMEAHRWDDARREGDAVNPLLTDPGGGSLRDGWRIIVDAQAHRFDAALAELRALPRTRDSDYLWTLLVDVLRTTGRGDDALKESSRLLDRFPASCLARATLAGLRLEHGQAPAAHQLADPVLRAAREAAAMPADQRCAATAAAAMGDAALLASVLDRIGSDQGFLQYWMLEVYGSTGRMLLAGGIYPFLGIVDKPQIAASRQRLDAAYERMRAVAESTLTGLP